MNPSTIALMAGVAAVAFWLLPSPLQAKLKSGAGEVLSNATGGIGEDGDKRPSLSAALCLLQDHMETLPEDDKKIGLDACHNLAPLVIKRGTGGTEP